MMILKRNILVFAVGFAMACGAATAQNVEQGQWINLFDGESLFGWITQGDAGWEVKEGAIVLDESDGSLLATTSHFKNFELTAKVKVTGKDTAGIEIRGGLQGHASSTGAGVIVLRPSDDVQEVHVKVIGNDIEATVNGKTVRELSVSNPSGHIGFQYHRTHSNRNSRPNEIVISEVKLLPLQLTSTFNGTDLSGWNIIPDHQSKFNVVDGAINITDGNGQIETDALYQDFLLQLDIISNGEDLNSGVFFRTPKGVFWKGYESQLKNTWIKEDRTRPFDYGTGGIYGVQETRKVVVEDFEWFTKTIVCHGNHMAVWINGYQVSDFYDHRPVNPNADAKNGFVPDAGTINLQGHDPTTDLSFKNINIQDYQN